MEDLNGLGRRIKSQPLTLKSTVQKLPSLNKLIECSATRIRCIPEAVQTPTPAAYSYIIVGGYNTWPESMLDGMLDVQKAVLEPPYHIRLKRPVLNDDGILATEA